MRNLDRDFYFVGRRRLSESFSMSSRPQIKDVQSLGRDVYPKLLSVEFLQHVVFYVTTARVSSKHHRPYNNEPTNVCTTCRNGYVHSLSHQHTCCSATNKVFILSFNRRALMPSHQLDTRTHTHVRMCAIPQIFTGFIVDIFLFEQCSQSRNISPYISK